MSSRHKRITFCQDYPLNVDTVQLRKTTYNTIKKEIRVGSLPLMVKFLRDTIYNAKYIGLYKKGDIEGHHFEHDGINIIVSKGYNLFVSAFKTQETEQVEIKENEHKPEVKPNEKGKIRIGDKLYNENDLVISSHADMRITERFFITETSLKKKFCLQFIRTSQYLGLQYDQNLLDSEACHLFVKNGEFLYVAPDRFEIVTLYEGQIGYYHTGKLIISPIIRSKLNGAKRKYKSVKKKHAYEELNIEEKIIQLKRAILNTRSETKQKEHAAEIEKELEKLKVMEEKRKVLKRDLKDLKYLYGCLA